MVSFLRGIAFITTTKAIIITEFLDINMSLSDIVFMISCPQRLQLAFLSINNYTYQPEITGHSCLVSVSRSSIWLSSYHLSTLSI